MLVKEILAQAAFLLGQEDVSEYLKSNSQSGLSAEELKDLTQKTDLLLRCYNMVENEVALDYLPLTAEERIDGAGEKIRYTSFLHTPVSVLSVTDERGNKIPYTVFPEYIKTDARGTVVVTYSYAPPTKLIGGESEYGARVPQRLFAYGVACEACLIAGLYDEASAWDKKYKDALLCAYSRNRPHVIRSRRWV